MSTLHALPRPLAFVFSEGAARAAAQVGMLEVIGRTGVLPDLVVGSSTGAINAAVYAAEPLFAVDALSALWEAIAGDSKLRSPWRSAVRGVSASQAARTAAVLRHLLDGALGQLTFSEEEIRLSLMATDLESGLAVALDDGNVVDAVMASCALPVILPPVPHGNTFLIDGSVAAGAPVAQAVARGAKSILLFDCGSSAVSEHQLDDLGWYAVMGYSFLHLVREQTAHDLAEVAGQVPVVVMSCESGSGHDLKAAPRLFEVGAETARTALANLDTLTSSPTQAGVYGYPAGLAADDRIAPLVR